MCARFIALTAGIEPPDGLVDAVHRETEGNPFFVTEVVRLLVAEGRLERPRPTRSWSVSIPESVREVVGRRLERLSEECNRVLTIAAVIGREFSLPMLERVSGLSTADLLDVLEEAVAGAAHPGRDDSRAVPLQPRAGAGDAVRRIERRESDAPARADR